MDTIITFMKNNYPWFFSGLGILLITAIFNLFRRKKKQIKREQGDFIVTTGNQSPGKVNGDYKVNIYGKKNKQN